jgi:hypothetical protein
LPYSLYRSVYEKLLLEKEENKIDKLRQRNLHFSNKYPISANTNRFDSKCSEFVFGSSGSGVLHATGTVVNLSCADVAFDRATHDRLESLLVSRGGSSIDAEMGDYRDDRIWIIGVTLGRRQCPIAPR